VFGLIVRVPGRRIGGIRVSAPVEVESATGMALVRFACATETLDGNERIAHDLRH
jgi:hypothetical protein